MEKTININLGGILFQIDEEAYKILRDYLRAIDVRLGKMPGGSEAIEDIESRIAEIFQSQKGTAGIISLENVVDMMKIIGKPEDFDQQDAETEQPGFSYRQPSGGKKLFRNPENQIISGVCGGLGAYINTDPVWIRILFVIFAFFLVGIFVYIALWIALPSASTPARKRDMYGTGNNLAHPDSRGSDGTNKIGKAFDVIFRTLGKFFYVLARVLLIVLGVCLVLTGFLGLVTFAMLTLFHYPDAFSTDVVGASISYLPDFLNYIISPALVPWVKAMIALVLGIPLLVFIYGGIRLIFWFRARDGFVWLAALILWVMAAAALSIMLFNEGIGFAEKGRTTYQEYFNQSPDTLYIRTGTRISDLEVDKEIMLPDEDVEIFYINDEKKEIYFRTSLDLDPSENDRTWVEIRKSSAGRSRIDAERKSERLVYNAKIKANTVYLDEFFTIPSGTKWSFDFVSVKIHIPEGTVIYMDKTTERLFHSRYDSDFVNHPDHRFWMMTDDGPDYQDPDRNFR